MTPPGPHPRPPSRLRTYSLLAGARRMPNEYELVTSRLLYHPSRGFEVEAPLAAWYRRHQAGSPLQLDDPERFVDPRGTTYARYVHLGRIREAYLDGLLEAIDQGGADRALDPAWRGDLARALSVLRFPLHGLQMAAAYLGSMAPGGRIAVACALQAADEMRRIQRFAYRLAQLALAGADARDDGRRAWQEEPRWQPLRETIERLLAAWDFGEAFAALTLCVKPVVDELVCRALPARARASGDEWTSAFCFSFDEDARWSREWSDALVALAFERDAGRAALRDWCGSWGRAAEEAIAPLAELVGGEEIARAVAAVRARRARIGIEEGA